MTDAADLLDAEGIAQLRERDEYDTAARALVVDVYAEARLDADDVLEEAKITTALTDALVELAEESEDPSVPVDAAKHAAGSAAQKLQEPRDELVDLIEDATRDLLDEHREQELQDGEGLAVPEGVGLDTYLEDELVEIVRQQSSDAVDDPVLRWRFRDGVRIETSESIHHDYYALFKKLASATDKRLVPELASEQAEDELREEEAIDGDTYARMSLGPKSRPWHTDSELWSRAISGLVQERIRTETVVGPRTDAWESIQARIQSGRAVRDLTDAVEHGLIHVDEDTDEVWIPTTMVDNAADQVETSRRALQAELAEREVTSSNLSGERVSEAVSRRATAMRFWRLDLDHDAVPDPETIIDEVADPVEQADVSGDDTAAAADGGAAPQHGTETFGRPPERDTDDSDTDDPPANGGDQGDGGDADTAESNSNDTVAESDDDPADSTSAADSGDGSPGGTAPDDAESDDYPGGTAE